MRPDFIKIYTDLITAKYPYKTDILQLFKSREELSTIDILNINNILFGEIKDQDVDNPKHKAYDIETINYILNYQKDYELTNLATSKVFNVSRNTISKWKSLKAESVL